MLKDFRTFLLKENVLTLALAVIIGGALSKLVAALAEDVIMPIVAVAIPGGAWREAVVAVGPARVSLGHFGGALVDFVVIGFVVWRLSRLFAKPAAATPPATTTQPCPYCDMPVSLRATRCGHCTSTLVDLPVLAFVASG